MTEEELVLRLRAAGCVFAEEEARLLLDESPGPGPLEERLARRVAGEPLETVLGWAELDGHRLAVASGVFVPRRRTELLARLAASRAGPGSVVVELCCGVAPVAAYVARTVAAVEVHVADVEPGALACARANVPGAGVHRGDLWDALPADLRGRVDVVAANAPYVPTAELGTMPREARDHEPVRALDGGADGAALHRRIAQHAPAWLAPGGVLLVEASPRRSDATRAALDRAGLETRVVTDPEVDGCVVVGVRRAARA